MYVTKLQTYFRVNVKFGSDSRIATNEIKAFTVRSMNMSRQREMFPFRCQLRVQPGRHFQL